MIKKSNRWYVKIELDPDPLTGKRRPKWHSGFRTKKEAEKARIDLLSKFDHGEYLEPSQQTLVDYLTDWLAAIEHTVRPSTFDSYKRNMHNHAIAPESSAQLQTEFEEAAHINRNTLNSLLRRREQPFTYACSEHSAGRRLMEDSCSVRLARTHPSIVERLNADEAQIGLTDVREGAEMSALIEATDACFEGRGDLVAPRPTDRMSAREASEWHMARVVRTIPGQSPQGTLVEIAKTKQALPTDQESLFEKPKLDRVFCTGLHNSLQPLSYAAVYGACKKAFAADGITDAGAVAATRLLAAILPTNAHHPHACGIDRDDVGILVPEDRDW